MQMLTDIYSKSESSLFSYEKIVTERTNLRLVKTVHHDERFLH